MHRTPQRHDARVGCIAAAIALSLLNLSAALGQPSVNGSASDADSTRWREHSFGLSLVPPADSFIRRPPPTDAAERFYLPNGSVIQISIEKTQGTGDPSGDHFSSFGVQGATRIEAGDQAIETAGQTQRMLVRIGDGLATVDEVMQFTIRQVAAIDPKAVVLDQRDGIDLAGHQAAMIYFRIPAGREPEWVLGLGVMQIDPRNFAVLRLESVPQSFEADRQIFERTFQTLHVKSPAELDAMRTELLRRGDEWLRTLTPPNRHAALHKEQWFRVIDGKEDVGWIRMEQRPEEYLAEAGVAVRIRSRIFTQVRNPRSERDLGAPSIIEKAIDTDNFFFLSDDRSTEVWTIHSTLRPTRGDRANAPNAQSPADQPFTQWEQGAASGPMISVTRGDQRFRWLRPEVAYLPQVDAFLLGALLPHDQPNEFGFYAYHAQSGRVGLLTARVAPSDQGGVELRVRPTPDSREHLYRYEPDGRLRSWQLPSGRVVRASSPDEIQLIWRGR